MQCGCVAVPVNGAAPLMCEVCEQHLLMHGYVAGRATWTVRTGLEVLHHLRAVGAVIGDLPPREHHEAVKEGEAEGRRGVDRGTDGDARFDEVLHHRHDLVRCVRVEPGSGFLQPHAHVDTAEGATE